MARTCLRGTFLTGMSANVALFSRECHLLAWHLSQEKLIWRGNVDVTTFSHLFLERVFARSSSCVFLRAGHFRTSSRVCFQNVEPPDMSIYREILIYFPF